MKKLPKEKGAEEKGTAERQSANSSASEASAKASLLGGASFFLGGLVEPYRSRSLRQHAFWLFLSGLSGLFAGIVVSLFLWLLDGATRVRIAEPRLLFFLPIAGLLIGWVFQRFGKGSGRGSNLILEEIHDPKSVLPRRLIPLVLGGAVISHLFGASTGREGAAVQFGASLSDQTSRFFRLGLEERKILLVCGAGAGSAAGIGTPLAGMIFGMEVIQIGRLRLFAWVECLVAAYLAEWTTHLLQAPHFSSPGVEIPAWEISILYGLIGFGFLSGLAARAFVFCVHLVERLHEKMGFQPMFHPLVGGLILVPLFLADPAFSRFEGLGLEEIRSVFSQAPSVWDPFLKAGFTALSVGSGFKGGEFIPLVFMGSTLASAIAGIFHLPISLFAALGFAAVFAGAANTPLACSVLAAEVFGWALFPYALVVCYLSYFFSGHAGIYRAQKMARSKHERIWGLLRLLGELPARFR